MTVDWTISAGSILQIAAFLIGGMSFAYALLFDVRQLKRDVVALGVEVKLVSKVMVELATVDGKFNTLGSRVERIEDDIRELRHGEGMVLPFRYRPPEPRE